MWLLLCFAGLPATSSRLRATLRSFWQQRRVATTSANCLHACQTCCMPSRSCTQICRAIATYTRRLSSLRAVTASMRQTCGGAMVVKTQHGSSTGVLSKPRLPRMCALPYAVQIQCFALTPTNVIQIWMDAPVHRAGKWSWHEYTARTSGWRSRVGDQGDMRCSLVAFLGTRDQHANFNIEIMQYFNIAIRCAAIWINPSAHPSWTFRAMKYASELSTSITHRPRMSNMSLGCFCGVALIPPPAQAALQMHNVREASLQTE